MRMAFPVSMRAVTTDALMSADLPERRGSRRSERMGNTTSTPTQPPLAATMAPRAAGHRGIGDRTASVARCRLSRRDDTDAIAVAAERPTAGARAHDAQRELLARHPGKGAQVTVTPPPGQAGRRAASAAGTPAGAQPGESLRLRGRWTSHPQYGRQFEVREWTSALPASIQGIRRYLGSGLIKGIGPKTAERIVDHLGLDTLRVIEETPDRLREVHGLGPKRAAAIGAAWEQQKAIKDVMVFLQGVGVSTSLAVRIYKTYGDDSIHVVAEDPYRLAADVWGIGFRTADTIARQTGIPHDSPDRVKAGLQFALSEAADAGHCYLPQGGLITEAARLLEVDQSLVGPCLDELVTDQGVIRERAPIPDPHADPSGDLDGAAVYLLPFHRAETALTTGLRRLLDSPAGADRLPAFAGVDWAAVFDWHQRRTGAQLAGEQQAAVRAALTERVAVLTGGPGCGKSFTVRTVVELARVKHAKVLLAAPTGRAAKRLAELTGTDAVTLHRLLELRPGGEASYDRDRPLDADLIVVDEASMLDVLLANKLVKAGTS